MTPVYLSERRFAWLHEPATRSGAGVVIVPPFGYEAICAHRALRVLAEACAAAGAIAVRVDLDGTGDSAGDDLERGRLDAWLASIADACDLARHAGADRLVLAGVRLGAALAALTARDDIAGLVAIAPVVSGKAYVREGRALQGALGLAPPPKPIASDGDELVGFALTAETKTAISQIDLTRATRRPAPHVLILDRDDLKPSDAWPKALAALGAEVTQRQVPGYVQMVLDPHRAEVPRAIVQHAVDFVGASRPRPAPARGVVRASRLKLGDLGEEPIAVDGLHAIATLPGRPSGRAVILLNAGAIRRIGPNRLHVPLARRLAASGDLVVRLDQSGLGDSAPRAGAADNIVYSEHAVGDVGAAVDWAKLRGSRHVAVVGLCSGAYHAYRAAVAYDAIDTIVPINPLTFHWVPGMPLDAQAFRVTADVNRYQSSLRDPRSWRKLLRGDVDVRRVARVVLHRARDLAEHRARDVARRLRIPLPHDLGTDLLAIARRGGAVRFVFASDDPGHTMLADGAGSALDRLCRSGAIAVTMIDGPDHTFTPRWSHELLLDAIARGVA